MIHAAVIGDTYYMGNTFDPEECKVTHLVSFADLPEPIQRRWLEMGAHRGHDARKDGYVCFLGKRKHGDTEAYCRFLPIDVFCACAHRSFEAMVADRARDDAKAVRGLPGAHLPGD